MSEHVIDADVGVVGAGPGGMAAATRLRLSALACQGRRARREGTRAGGQIYRQLPEGASRRPPTSPSRQATTTATI